MDDRAPNPPTTTSERCLATLAAFVGVPLLTLIVCGRALLDRPFWADETLSWLIASDANPSHAMGALAGAMDCNAPLIYWFFRAVGNAFGHTPFVYRTASAAFLSLALLGLYLTLRQAVRAGPAIVGCLAFWALPIVVAHQTETRFYGPLVAAAIWTCFFIGRRRQRTTIADAIGLSLASIALCGTHYFGVIALACVCIVELARSPRVRTIGGLLPTLCGFTLTLCLWPVLRTQRAVLADVGGTWLPDTFWANLTTSVRLLVPALPLLAFLICTAAAVAIAGRRRVVESIGAATRSPLAGLGLFIVAVIAFDRLVQPVLVPRYLMPALPAGALLIAAVASSLPRRAIGITAVGMLAIVVGDLSNVRDALRNPPPRTAMAIVRSVEHVPAGVPVLVDWRCYLLPIWAARADLRGQLAFVDDPRLADDELAKSIPLERRMVDVMRRFYGFPTIVPVDAVRRCDHFVLVTEFPERVDERFAGWNKRQLGSLTFEMKRIGAAKAE